MSRILVTGGAGFIGSHLVDLLLAADHKVTVLDNLANGSLANLASAWGRPGFAFAKGDVLNAFDCLQAMQGCEFVFHLACLGVRHSLHSPLENHRVNAEGTLNVLEAARRNAVKRFFYISSSEVYGETKSFPITETSGTYPTTVYGASKLAGEHYTNAYRRCFGLATIVLRIFNNYGPRAHYEGDAGEIIPRSIVKILYGESPTLFGDGLVTRDFFYVKDTARALAGLLDVASLGDETMNIGTGREITMKELVTRILTLMAKTGDSIRFLPSRPADVPRLWVCADRFFSRTGFKPRYDFDDGLRETIQYYEALKTERNLIAEIEEINWVKQGAPRLRGT